MTNQRHANEKATIDEIVSILERHDGGPMTAQAIIAEARCKGRKIVTYGQQLIRNAQKEGTIPLDPNKPLLEIEAEQETYVLISFNKDNICYNCKDVTRVPEGPNFKKGIFRK